MDQILINILNGVSSGLLLFMLSSGLTLIFSMMGVLNFAHASFYMIGAYVAYTLTGILGFWPALVFAPLLVGLMGAGFERTALRRVHKFGHVPELLITFGLSYVVLEVVQLIWGRTPLAFDPPAFLQGPAFTLVQQGGSLSVALGHNVPRVFMLVFGSGCALAALAGVIGGITFVTEPAMAAVVGSIIFVVVVVGGMGSLAGAFVASLLIGLLQTLPLTVDKSFADAINSMGGQVGPSTPGWPLLRF